MGSCRDPFFMRCERRPTPARGTTREGGNDALRRLRHQRTVPVAWLGPRVRWPHPRQRVRAPLQGWRTHHVRRPSHRHDRLLRGHRHRRVTGCRVGAQQPHARLPEQLVPLRQGLRGTRRLPGLHGHQVQVGQARPRPLVPRLAVRHRGHQHPDRGVLRLRERLPLLRARRDHLGHVRGRHAARRMEQRVQRHRRHHQHLLHDRLVERLRVQGRGGHALARHDVGLHHRL